MLFDLDPTWLAYKLLTVPLLIFSLVVHECAHARTALAFGDPTARNMGRITLNPLPHLDFMGTICLLFSGFIGWAKPVPVNPYNLHPRRLGDIAVSFAGPASNLSLAVVFGLIIKGMILLAATYIELGQAMPFRIAKAMFVYAMAANVGLFVFNLIPLFPLDGHHIARELLPPSKQEHFMHWQMQFGVFILLAIVFAPTLLAQAGYQFFDPVIVVWRYVYNLLAAILGIRSSVGAVLT
jgi:Zn-dependent protease